MRRRARRAGWKTRLVRGLYERGFSAKDVRELFRVIDWLMELPPVLRKVLRQEVDKIQEEKRMPTPRVLSATHAARAFAWASQRD